ncbi:hypothetical protein RCK40_24465, partial [Salmonella enterica subsp. enterica serovar 1,4,[5],12:i:-]
VANGVEHLAGHAAKSIGGFFNSESIVKTGQDWINSSNKWFTAGKEAIGQSTSKSSNSESSAVSASGQYKDFYKVDGAATDYIAESDMRSL